MGRYPQTEDPESFKRLAEWICQHGVPGEKVTEKWLRGIGFSSSRHRGFPKLLKFAGLIDGKNMPTDLWKTARGSGEFLCIADNVRSG